MSIPFRSDWGQRLWDSMQPRDAAAARQVDAAVAKLLLSRQRYQAIQGVTGVPWFWIAAVHWRESTGNFEGVLHNGQKIIGTGRKTTIVPKGRGPFRTWEQAAIDALTMEGRELDEIDPNPLDDTIEWNVNRLLYEWERYNGFGYVWRAGQGKPSTNSPYVWSYSNHYQQGKYVRDGHYDHTHVDRQIGVAMILQRLMLLDPEVAAFIESGAGTPPPSPEPGTEERLHDLLDELKVIGFEAALTRVGRPPA